MKRIIIFTIGVIFNNLWLSASNIGYSFDYNEPNYTDSTSHYRDSSAQSIQMQEQIDLWVCRLRSSINNEIADEELYMRLIPDTLDSYKIIFTRFIFTHQQEEKPYLYEDSTEWIQISENKSIIKGLYSFDGKNFNSGELRIYKDKIRFIRRFTEDGKARKQKLIFTRSTKPMRTSMDFLMAGVSNEIDKKYKTDMSMASIDSLKADILSWTSHTPSRNYTKEHICSALCNRILMMSAAADPKYDSLIVRDCDIMLMLNPESEINQAVAFASKAVVYGNLADKEKLTSTVDKFKIYSALCGGRFDNQINDIIRSFSDLFNPPAFTEEVKGYWVLTDYSTGNSKGTMMPYCTFKIENPLKRSYGGILLMNRPGINSFSWNDPYQQPLQESREIMGEWQSRSIGAVFANDIIKKGNIELATIFADLASEIKYNAERALSEAPPGVKWQQALNFSFTTSIIAGIISLAAEEAAKPSRTFSHLSLEMQMQSPKVMKGRLCYSNYKITPGKNETPPPVFDKPNLTFVKWEQEDDIFFIDDKLNVVTPFTLTHETQDMIDSELKTIKKTISLRKPKYWLPIIGCLAAGAGLIAGGVSFIQLDESNWDFGTGLCVLGVASMAYGPVWSAKLIKRDRRRACQPFNHENRNKLIEKSKTATISINTTYDPVTKTAGIGTQLTF